MRLHLASCNCPRIRRQDTLRRRETSVRPDIRFDGASSQQSRGSTRLAARLLFCIPVATPQLRDLAHKLSQMPRLLSAGTFAVNRFAPPVEPTNQGAIVLGLSDDPRAG